MKATVTRALAILGALGDEGGAAPRHLAETLGLPLSTVYRYLSLFVDHGFAAKDESNGLYMPGVKLVLLAQSPHASYEIVSLARENLEELQAATGETVFLVRRNGVCAICLDVVDSRDRVKLTMRKGESFPLYASAPSKVLLAFSPPLFRERFVKTVDLKRLATQTITDRKRLRREIERIRALGYAHSTSELDEMASAVAFPVLESDGNANFSVGIAGPTTRFAEKMSELVDITRTYAERIAGKSNVYLSLALQDRNMTARTA